MYARMGLFVTHQSYAMYRQIIGLHVRDMIGKRCINNVLSINLLIHFDTSIYLETVGISSEVYDR